jgi:AraC-like DNA-binding protein
MTFPVRYAHLQVVIDVKRRVMNAIAGAPSALSITEEVRELGRALEGFATEEPHAALLLLVTAAEEFRQVIGGTDDHKAMLESALAFPDAPLEEVLGGIERTLALMVEQRPARSDTSARVRKVLDIIERRYVEPLKIRTLARHVCRSPAHVASQFRRETGFTIHRYLTHVRMQHAEEMLKRGEKVEAVMLLVGYNSKKSFYARFRTHTGQTPGCFRRSLHEFNSPSQ